MNYNPYAAPQAPPPIGGGSPYAGRAQPWSISEVLNGALEAFKNQWATVVGAMFLFGFCMVPFASAPYILQATGVVDELTLFYATQGTLSYIVMPIIEAFLIGGFMRILLSVVRGQPTSVGDLFSGAHLFLPMLGAIWLRNLILTFGCCFGGYILLGMGLSFAPFFIVDQSMGPLDAMKAAWEATDGQRAEVFLFALACVGVEIAGFMACGIGLFVAYPIAALAQAIVYVRITGRAGGPPMLGPGGFGPPPDAGGFGPPPGGQGGFGGPGAPGGGFGGPPGYGPPGGGGGYGPPGGYGGGGGGRPPGY